MANKTRVLIEGSFQDDWVAHYVDTGVYEIPEKTTLLNVGMYELGLVIHNGVPVYAALGTKIEIDYQVLTKIHRPTTLITEDKRVFHDVTLREFEFGWNAHRLEHLIEVLHEKYGQGAFEKLYREIESEGKFKRIFGDNKLSTFYDFSPRVFKC